MGDLVARESIANFISDSWHMDSGQGYIIFKKDKYQASQQNHQSFVPTGQFIQRTDNR